MALSSSDIQRINSQKSAIVGKKYYGDDGEIYIGIVGGRLRKLDKANKTIFKPTLELESKNVQDAIEEVDTKVENDVVKSLNTLKGNITLKQGTNVIINQSGQEITITFNKPADIVFDDTKLVEEDKTLQEQIDEITDLFKRLLIDVTEQGFEPKDEKLLIELDTAYKEITELK